MNWMKTLCKLAIAATLLSAGAANATLYKFDLTGQYSGSWELDTARAPDQFKIDSFVGYHDVAEVPATTSQTADIYFYSTAAGGGGGVVIIPFWGAAAAVDTFGPQLYSGTEDNPIFTLGSFSLTNTFGAGAYDLTISLVGAPPAAVPEPATGALLLGGLGLLVASRRRKIVR